MPHPQPPRPQGNNSWIRDLVGTERRTHPSPWLAPGLAMLIPVLGGAIAYGILQERVETLRDRQLEHRVDIEARMNEQRASIEHRIRMIEQQAMPRAEIETNLRAILRDSQLVREDIRALRADLGVSRTP